VISRRSAAAFTLFLALALSLAGTARLSGQDHTPQPYDPSEFQAWMKEAFRAEAVFAGSFPFTLFFTLEAYDTMRYVSNSFSPAYAPWPFGSGTAVTYTAEETLWLAVSAVSLSMVISGIDFLIGRANDRRSSSP
jgi:hypothetical protein